MLRLEKNKKNEIEFLLIDFIQKNVIFIILIY